MRRAGRTAASAPAYSTCTARQRQRRIDARPVPSQPRQFDHHRIGQRAAQRLDLLRALQWRMQRRHRQDVLARQLGEAALVLQPRDHVGRDDSHSAVPTSFGMQLGHHPQVRIGRGEPAGSAWPWRMRSSRSNFSSRCGCSEVARADELDAMPRAGRAGRVLADHDHRHAVAPNAPAPGSGRHRARPGQSTRQAEEQARAGSRAGRDHGLSGAGALEMKEIRRDGRRRCGLASSP